MVPTDDEFAIRTIYQEAEGESMAGKVAVAYVILNRTRTRYSSDGTVIETVLRDRQFSGWNNLTKSRSRSVKTGLENKNMRDSLEAWYLAKAGAVADPTKGAVLYFNPAIVRTPYWATPSKARLTARIGAHNFYVPRA